MLKNTVTKIYITFWYFLALFPFSTPLPRGLFYHPITESCRLVLRTCRRWADPLLLCSLPCPGVVANISSFIHASEFGLIFLPLILLGSLGLPTFPWASDTRFVQSVPLFPHRCLPWCRFTAVGDFLLACIWKFLDLLSHLIFIVNIGQGACCGGLVWFHCLVSLFLCGDLRTFKKCVIIAANTPQDPGSLCTFKYLVSLELNFIYDMGSEFSIPFQRMPNCEMPLLS